MYPVMSEGAGVLVGPGVDGIGISITIVGVGDLYITDASDVMVAGNCVIEMFVGWVRTVDAGGVKALDTGEGTHDAKNVPTSKTTDIMDSLVFR